MCGEWVRKGQAACEECGSCANSGWGMGDDLGGVDLPDDDFDYDAFIEREFGGGSERKLGEGRWAGVFWWAAVLVLLAFGWMFFGWMFR